MNYYKNFLFFISFLLFFSPCSPMKRAEDRCDNGSNYDEKLVEKASLEEIHEPRVVLFEKGLFGLDPICNFRYNSYLYCGSHIKTLYVLTYDEEFSCYTSFSFEV